MLLPRMSLLPALVLLVLRGSCAYPSGQRAMKATLPSPMIAAYTSTNSPEKILSAVEGGVNVIFWSFMELRNNTLSGGVTPKTVGPVYQALARTGHANVLHFISFGGWDVSHTLAGTCGASPCSGQAYADAFRFWNAEMRKSVPGFPGFAGIDWDIEGVNDLKSLSNEFNLETYEVMLNMTLDLRRDFLVSMVPPQSYFNCKEPGFSLSLRNTAESNPNFTYAGKNAYAPLYAKCPDCFDLVMVQVYESYSVAGFDLFWQGSSAHVGKAGWPRAATSDQESAVVRSNMQCLASGWTVDFGGFWGLSVEKIAVPADKIVIGLANKWALPSPPSYKVPYFSGAACGKAWCEGLQAEQSFTSRARGFMYWDIGDDRPNASFAADLHSSMWSCMKPLGDIIV